MSLLEALNWKLPYLKFTSDSFSHETFTGIFISTDVTKATEVNIQNISWILMDGQYCWWREADLQIIYFRRTSRVRFISHSHSWHRQVLFTPTRICLKNKKHLQVKKSLCTWTDEGTDHLQCVLPCEGDLVMDVQTENMLRWECVGWEALLGTEKWTRIWNHVFKTDIQKTAQNFK